MSFASLSFKNILSAANSSLIKSTRNKSKFLLKFFLIIFTLNLANLALATKSASSPSRSKSDDSQNEKDEDDNQEIKLPSHLDEEEYKLVEVTPQNFNETLTKAEHFFLLIHNPWCKYSQKMDERLLAIHKILKLETQSYYIGVMDASLVDSGKFLDEFVPKENFLVTRIYPKLVYFKNSKAKEVYSGKHTRDSMLNYIKRKIHQEAIKLPLQAIFDYKVIHDKHAFILVNGNAQNETLSHAQKLANSEASELFSKQAIKHQSHMFYQTSDKKVVDYLFAKNATSFGNETVYSRNLNVLYFSKGKLLSVYLNDKLKVFFERSLNYFISKQNAANYFTRFSEDAINEIFMKKQSAFILFRNIFDNSTEYLEQNLPLLASQEAGLKFLITDIAGKYELKLAKLMLISNKNLPSIRIIDFNGGFRRYEYEGSFDNENVLGFIKKWKKGELKPYYSTSNIQDSADAVKKKEVIRRIGNANFYDSVVLAKRNVMVLFYTNWCAHCKKVKISFLYLFYIFI
jgi:thiol-disulfide isomerase/thioredoxin